MASAIQTITLLIIFHSSCLLKVFANDKTQIIESFHVKSDIRYRFATTQVESVIRNVADKAQEIGFDVTLPKEAFIVRFSMDIDGKVYDGEVKERTTAKKQYQAAVDRGESAGHVRVAPRHSNLFEVSANVANGTAAKFTLTYQEMLHRKYGLYQHEVHVNLGQKTVNDFLIEVFIQENKPLTVLKSPSLRKGSLINNKVEADNKLTTIDRPSTLSAHITYKSSLSDENVANTSFTFVVEYDVEHSLQGEVLVVDGYFVHFFSPDLPSMPKDIVFVLDVSGSMYGEKIQQLKDAMVAILDDLQPDDRFSIITFSSHVDRWLRQLVTATKHNIDKAKRFITSISAEGGTDINSALLAGISELLAREDNKRVGMIFFLTDGLATSGVVNPEQIAVNVLSSNRNISSIFGLAFGSGADYNLLTTISGQNSGFARKIFEDSDTALQVASLYEEISAVSVKDISINYLPSSVDEYTVTNTKFPVIFNGSEVIICGRMADNVNVFQMEIKGLQKSGPLDLTLEVDDVNNLVIGNNENLNTFFTMPRDFSGIVEKMWAYITVRQYLKEKEIFVSDEAKVEELKNKILQISLKYKFVTPLTSMVVTKPETSEKPIESGLEDANDIVQNSEAARQLRPMYSLGPLGNRGGHNPMSFPHKSFYPRRKESERNYNSFVDIGKKHVSVDDSDVSLIMSQYSLNQQSAQRPTIRKPTVNRKASSGPTIKHTSNVSSGFHVSAVIVKEKNLSICLAPKNLKEGKYKLIQSSDGSGLIIQTACSGRKCKKFLIKSIILKSKGSSTKFSVDENGDWIYQNASFFSFTRTDSNTIIISAKEFEITITRRTANGSLDYIFFVHPKYGKRYKGLIGKVLNRSAKNLMKLQKAKIPDVCSDKVTDISKYLTNRMAAKYRN